MNAFDLTACLELNIYIFLSRICLVVASGPSVLPDHPPLSYPKHLGVGGVFAWLVRNPTKSSPA